MTIATFRTEGFDDGERVPSLMGRLGVEIVRSWVEDDAVAGDRWPLDFFTINIPDGETVETVRGRMEHLIETEDEFADLHRCSQTLKEGDDCGDPFALSIKEQMEKAMAPCDRCSQTSCACGNGHDIWPPVTSN